MKEKIKLKLSVLNRYTNERQKLKLSTLLVFTLCVSNIAGENAFLAERVASLNQSKVTERRKIENVFGRYDYQLTKNTKTPIINVTSEDEERDIKQEIVVSGRVVDEDGFPMPGVQVAVKETKGVGVVTGVVR